MHLKCISPTGRSCVISIFVLRQPDRGLGELSRCHGPTTSSRVWKKSGLVTQLEASTDAEIAERISKSVASYTTESNEDTFKLDIIFDSLHYKEKTLISDRALLAGFLMLWLKRCVLPTLPQEVIIADVVYLAVLAHGRSLSLLPIMIGCLQNGL